MKNKEKIYITTSVVLMLDQFIKLIVAKNMTLNQEISVIPHFFSLYYVENTGAAFSILKDSTLFLTIISVVFICLLHFYIKKEEHFTKLGEFSLGMILGGIFGNLIDRILHHAVTDYLSFTFGSYAFPVFNLADIGITVGVCLFLLDVLLEKKKR